MKTLVIVSHPNIEHSVVNAQWIKTLSAHSDAYTVHHLESVYPDGKIDAKAEQALIERHGTVIFQFPVYWFSCPPLLKAWLDTVLTHGWAFGSQAAAFKGRKIGLAVSRGTPDEGYQETGKVSHRLNTVLTPFSATANYIGAEYLPVFDFHALEFFSEEEKLANQQIMNERAQQSAQDLLNHLQKWA